MCRIMGRGQIIESQMLLKKYLEKSHKSSIFKILKKTRSYKNPANKIASVINGTVISINPLAYNYLDNMENIAQTIARELKNQ